MAHWHCSPNCRVFFGPRNSARPLLNWQGLRLLVPTSFSAALQSTPYKYAQTPIFGGVEGSWRPALEGLAGCMHVLSSTSSSADNRGLLHNYLYGVSNTRLFNGLWQGLVKKTPVQRVGPHAVRQSRVESLRASGLLVTKVLLSAPASISCPLASLVSSAFINFVQEAGPVGAAVPLLLFSHLFLHFSTLTRPQSDLYSTCKRLPSLTFWCGHGASTSFIHSLAHFT
jgi:hypothetical protein